MTARRIYDDTLETVLEKRQLQSKYDKRLAVVMERAEYLLGGPPPPYYPHHGVNHSLHVIESMSELLYDPNKYLRPEEWYCLRAAAYLHDIGMYLERLGIEPSRAVEESVHPKKLDERDWLKALDERNRLMRQRHANTVYEIISAEQRRTSLGTLGLTETDGCLDSIARIVLGHSGQDNFKRAVQESNSNPREPENKPMREVSWIALFRLADELDLHKTRVDGLDIGAFPDEASVHCYRHAYVESIHAQRGWIKIKYVFNDAMPCKVEGYLREFTEFKLLAEIERTKPYIDQLVEIGTDVRFDRDNDVDVLCPSPRRPPFPDELIKPLIALARGQHDDYEAIKQPAHEA